MSILVVSDLHGATGELEHVLEGHSTLILLGDLINLLDYKTKTGILYEVFSIEDVERVSTLRAAGRFEEARRVIGDRAARKGPGLRAEIAGKVRRQYAELFEVLVDPTYLILGNVDDPDMVQEFSRTREGIHLVDGCTVDIEGKLFGFVGGALPTPFGAAGEVTEQDMSATINRLGEVDFLCSHIPPDIPELCFDTLAGRAERGSRDLLTYIHDVKPRIAYFGHVHQPLVSSMYVGSTLCINVGYFRTTGRAWLHQDVQLGEEEEWPEL